MVIAEATQDDFWGVGVAPNLTEHTKPSKFLGLNQLGILHMKLRDIVSEREPQNCNSDFDVPSTHLISTTPHVLSITDFSTTEHIICQTLPLNGETTSPPASESLEESIVVSVLLIGHLGNQGLKGVIHAQQGRM